MTETRFEYGWCYTDEKDGQKIRKDLPRADYATAKPYANIARYMLDKLGLPWPERIFRGSTHDLLFLNSHGIVVRIGPTDVEALMNPGILQPLGWVEDRESLVHVKGVSQGIPFSVTLYPGIEQYNSFYRRYKSEENGRRKSCDEENRTCFFGDTRSFLRDTYQGMGDCYERNQGVLRIVDETAEETAVAVLLDSDNERNSAAPSVQAERAACLKAEASQFSNKAECVDRMFQCMFNDAGLARPYHRAFQVHQPLRQMFWEAFRNQDKPDVTLREAFWEKCAAVTNNPETVVLPTWRLYQTEDGDKVFRRSETVIPAMVLYRPWTGDPVDDIAKSISLSPELKERVRQAHASRFEQKPDGRKLKLTPLM